MKILEIGPTTLIPISCSLILEGSAAVAKATNSCQGWIRTLRDNFQNASVLVPFEDPKLLRFNERAAFARSNAASAVVYGGNKSGHVSWRLEDGRILLDVEKQDSDSVGENS
jgi:hypothetical protein